MRAMYIMLSWAGWVWLLFAGGYVVTRLRREAAAAPVQPRASSESEQSDA